jgi:hypothetical protein
LFWVRFSLVLMALIFRDVIVLIFDENMNFSEFQFFAMSMRVFVLISFLNSKFLTANCVMVKVFLHLKV